MNSIISTPPANTPEDPFFILRDSRLLFQRRLTEIVRLAGVVAPKVIEAFVEALGVAHDELAASNQRDGFEQSHGLTASRITLMCDDDLELEIRIGDIARRLVDVGGNALWRVHLRYMTLLRRPAMAPEDNPVGPESIGQGLWAICRSSDAGHEGNFTLLERIEEQLKRELPDLYNGLNDLLASRHIEPAQTKIASTGGARQPTTPQAAPSSLDNRSNSLSTLQSMLNQQQGGGAAGNPGMATAQGENPGGNIALNAATLVMLNQLAARLDQLELSGTSQDLFGNLPETAQDMQPRTVRAKDLDLPLGKPEAIALDTMAHIFEAIFDIWALPDTVKTTIGRLQIPLLKLAIFDPLLFSDTQHPAHRLINGMARAAVGLPRNVNRSHPISTRLWQIAGTVAETLQGDPSALTAPLAELDALITERDHEIQMAAAPYILLLKEKESRDHARLTANKWLESIEMRGAAAEILAFLRDYWVHVMAAASGETEEAKILWQENDATIADLLWSVEPKQSVEERKRLAGLVASLLKRISNGLDQIGTPAEERTAFLDTCFTLQTAALRGSPAVPVKLTPAPAQANNGKESGIVIELLEADGRQLKILTLPDHSASPYRTPEMAVETGSWLQFEINENEPLCGLVCWQNPQSGRTVLLNPDWGYAVALDPSALAQQLHDNQAKVVSSLAIFDLAAERALSQLGKV